MEFIFFIVIWYFLLQSVINSSAVLVTFRCDTVVRFSLSDIARLYLMHPTFHSWARLWIWAWVSNLSRVLLSVLQSFKTLSVGSSSADGPNPNIAPFYVLKLLTNFGKTIALSFSISEEKALMDSSRNWRRHLSGFDFSKIFFVTK